MTNINGNNRQKSMKYLWGYVIALFAISLVLIFLSYGSQQKLKDDLLSVNQTLTMAMENSDSMENTVKLQQKVIDSMKTATRDMSKQVETLSGLIGQLENKNSADTEDGTAAPAENHEQQSVTDAEKMSDIISQMREVTDNLSHQLSVFKSDDK